MRARAYRHLPSIYDYNTLTTDEAIIPIRGGDWYDGGLWNAMYQHKWTADDEPLYDTWKYIYKVIVLCNRSLDIIDARSPLGSSTPVLDASEAKEYKAEVRAVRALMYYEAMDMFGRVPLVLSTMEQPYTQTVDGSELPRSRSVARCSASSSVSCKMFCLSCQKIIATRRASIMAR